MTALKWIIAFLAPFFTTLAAQQAFDQKAYIVALAAGFSALGGMGINKGIDSAREK